MRVKRLTEIAALAVTVVFISNAAFAAHAPEISEKMTGQSLPKFTLQTLEGKPFSDQNIKGPALFNFFASWCPPCRKELTALRDLNARYGQKIQFVGVLIDPVVSPDTVKDARSFLAHNPLPYPVLMMSAAMRESFKFEGIPTVYLTDRNRKFATTLYGPQPKQTIEQHLQKITATK